MNIDKWRKVWYIAFYYMTQRFLKAEEVAELLKLNILTIYKYIQKAKLQAVKFGRSYRIEEKDLEKFIKEHKIKNK